MTTCLFGALPGEGIDQDAMRNTLHAVSRNSGPQSSVTWGTAMLAMCAARLDEPDRAIQLLSGPFENESLQAFGIYGAPA